MACGDVFRKNSATDSATNIEETAHKMYNSVIGKEMAMAKATKLPSGKWRCKAYYTDEYGNYKSKSFAAEKKKDEEGAAALSLMERRHASRPENKTMGELIDRYIDSQSNLLSPSTIVGYRKIRRTAFQDIVDV